MAATQRVVWTAIPNGKSGGRINLSVHISPRLAPSGSPGQLAEFPEWVQWPVTTVTWSVLINGVAHAAKVVSAAPNLALWSALFGPSTLVNPFTYPNLTGDRFFSYPAAFVRQYFLNTYTTLASASPTEWPDGQTQLLQGAFADIPTNDDAEQALVSRLLSLFPPRGGPIPPRGTADAGLDLEQAKLFIDTLTVPAPTTDNAHTPRPAPPTIDFHQALSLIARHPPLMRALGLVVDLTVPVPSGALPNPVSVSVQPTWSPTVPDTDVLPTVMADPTTWRAAPRTSQPELAAGQLRLSDPGAYQLVEMDLDGATAKTINFAHTVARSLGPYRSLDTPTAYAVPALRSAGLSLARTANAAALYGALQNSDALNAAIAASPPGPVTLFAEDVCQGYRIDVYDKNRNGWRQLCARSAAPSPGPGGYAVGSPPTIVAVPPGDEGWVELGLTSPADGTSGNQCLPETLFGWQGFSLVAPRPGQHLAADPTDALQPENYNPATGAFPLQIAYVPTAGTLPVLRFGHTYRLRARSVDLAGNSIAFSTSTAASAFTWASPSAFYGRLEPVATPVLVPTSARTPGEHLERLVIRSNYDIPDNDPTIVPNSRWVAPPTSSVQLAEQHGILDDSSGLPQGSLYPTLAAADGLTFSTPSVVSGQGGLSDTQPLNAGQEWIYYPGSTLTAPYLPDVIARGAAFQFLPGTTAVSPTTLGSFVGSPWPGSQSFLLEVKPGSGAPVLPSSSNQETLTVLAPKASITTVRLSSHFSSGDLGKMLLWNWLSAAGLATPALKAAVLSGQHWMFTPYREIVIVHAVQQPLLAPTLPTVTPTRLPAATYTTIDGDIGFDAPSSQRLDVLAQWTEPFDDGVNPVGSVELAGNGRVGELDIALGSPDTVALSAMRHDFGDTKHRIVYYEARATSRFLEYFASYTSATLTGTTPVTIDAAGLAPGATIVTDATTSVSYQSGVDFVEDDTTGTIARIPGGAIASPTTVDVQYVVPPVTRSSIEPGTTPPTPLGAPASIPSSARPSPVEIAYVLPAFEWISNTTSTKVKSARAGNILRVYLQRPWWSSGEDEQLGVLVAHPPLGTVLPDPLLPLVTRYGRDPLFVSGAVSPNPSVSDFFNGVDSQDGVLLAEQQGTTPWVDVVGHAVNWDPTHKLWYADVVVFAGASYWPFIRLALVRYQPNSLPGFEVSPVTQADFAQLAPDRAATLTFPTPTSVHVVVSGVSFSGNASGTPPLMTAWVEQAQPGVTDPELKWVLAGAPTVTLAGTTVSGTTTWKGTLPLPIPRGSQPLRIAIAEAEQYPIVEASDANDRITYFDAIPI
jgi:hypothetical protein